MSLVWIASILMLLAITLIAAEIILPLHGTSLVGALATLAVCVAICFARSVYAGLGSITALAVLMPSVLFWFVRIWPLTPIGRRLVMPSVPARIASPSQPTIGMQGIATSQLRPSGICEFSGMRTPAFSQSGLIERGAVVRVTQINNGRVVVETI